MHIQNPQTKPPTHSSLPLQIPPTLQTSSHIPQRQIRNRNLPKGDVMEVAVLFLRFHGECVVVDGLARLGTAETEAAGSEEEEYA